MSVVGFDVGSSRAVVAVARAGGVDVICNEVSERATPCMVSFDSKRRFLGDAAKTQQMGNFKNTVSSLNRFIGRSPGDAGITGQEKKYWTCQLGEKEGEVAASVQYRGEAQVFSATELMGMFLGKLKGITQTETKGAVSDCVISVPLYFTEAQRRAMLDAAGIAGLNCLRLVNDTTATALCYGLTKNEQFGERPRTVCFVDMGYAGLKVAVVAFTKGHLEVKGTAFDANLGGRDFDEVLLEHFAAGIKTSYGEDITASPRGLLRLRTACEKIKKVLSGISFTKLDLETETRDFPLSMTREVFEGMMGPLLGRVEACLLRAIASAGLGLEGIDAVEIVGGATRIPAVKQLITATFKKEPSTTLNQDEAIARGSAFQCAIESPSFRVREFGVKDLISFPVKVTWGGESGEGVKEVEAFPLGSNLPSVKPLFLAQQLPIAMQAAYSCPPEALPVATDALIATFAISGAKPLAGPNVKTRVDIAINGHGLVSVKKALLVEEVTEQVPAAEPDAAPQTRKIIREHELSVTCQSASKSAKDLQKLRDAEFALALNDKYAQELDDSRNSLEEYIYEMRAKLEAAYKPFVREEDAAAFTGQLSAAEDWLYSEHEGENKEMYLKKLGDLQKVGGPIALRAKEQEARPQAEHLLKQLIATILAKTEDLDLSPEDLAKVNKDCSGKLAWLEAESAKQAALPLTAVPSLTSTKVNEARDTLLTLTSPIFARAKPKQAPASESPASAETKSEETRCSDESCQQNHTAEQATNMDID